LWLNIFFIRIGSLLTYKHEERKMALPVLVATDWCFQTIGSLREFEDDTIKVSNKSQHIASAALIFDVLATINGIVLGTLGLTLLGFHPAASYALLGVGAVIPLVWIVSLVKEEFCEN
jgi:hypothetical protein